jgi:tetratricopeptide (TPR) repeat protein
MLAGTVKVIGGTLVGDGANNAVVIHQVASPPNSGASISLQIEGIGTNLLLAKPQNVTGPPTDFFPPSKSLVISGVFELNVSLGEGVAKDVQLALQWYRKAADQGHAGEQNNLGTMYMDGAGVKQDYAEAFRWFRKSAEQDDASAQENLGAMYEKGLGVGQDYDKAIEWFTKAEKNGAKDASARLLKAQINQLTSGSASKKP